MAANEMSLILFIAFVLHFFMLAEINMRGWGKGMLGDKLDCTTFFFPNTLE